MTASSEPSSAERSELEGEALSAAAAGVFSVSAGAGGYLGRQGSGSNGGGCDGGVALAPVLQRVNQNARGHGHQRDDHQERYEAGIGFFAPATRTLGRAARPLLGPARTLLRPTGPLLRPAGGFSIITHVRFLL